MGIRSTHLPYDIQDCLYALVGQYVSATSPWTNWQAIRGWPESDILSAESKNYIYILDAQQAGTFGHQGGKSRNIWEVVIGFWVTRDKGGADEMAIWVGQMFDKFQNPQEIHTKQFTVTLGTTTYTNTTLTAMGIAIRDIRGPSSEMGENLKEFRREMILTLIA